ncbi:FadR/GntR family transcriptional regulator [Solibacillus sp. FSL H8-0523]|uniref:FadR/GntR family transcriptional regulator n=1 Tax=Solibacillus sp. FSL H8-0523 TaxID=2954511 RepID=UPI0031017520
MRTLTTSTKQKVYEMVFQEIQQDILAGRYEMGEKLPSERALAIRYQVSRNSIREAIRLLELRNLVEIKHGDGTFIKNISIQSTKNELVHVLENTDKTSIYEMLELRYILESQCAFLAALRANTQDFEKIANSLEMMKAAKADEKLGIQADLSFHIAIAEATHNQVLVELIASLMPHIRNTIEVTRNYRLAENKNICSTFDEHKQIYLAISRGDSEQAKTLMENHIRTIREELSERLL